MRAIVLSRPAGRMFQFAVDGLDRRDLVQANMASERTMGSAELSLAFGIWLEGGVLLPVELLTSKGAIEFLVVGGSGDDVEAAARHLAVAATGTPLALHMGPCRASITAVDGFAVARREIPAGSSGLVIEERDGLVSISQPRRMVFLSSDRDGAAKALPHLVAACLHGLKEEGLSRLAVMAAADLLPWAISVLRGTEEALPPLLASAGVDALLLEPSGLRDEARSDDLKEALAVASAGFGRRPLRAVA